MSRVRSFSQIPCWANDVRPCWCPSDIGSLDRVRGEIGDERGEVLGQVLDGRLVERGDVEVEPGRHGLALLLEDAELRRAQAAAGGVEVLDEPRRKVEGGGVQAGEVRWNVPTVVTEAGGVREPRGVLGVGVVLPGVGAQDRGAGAAQQLAELRLAGQVDAYQQRGEQTADRGLRARQRTRGDRRE